MSDRMEVEKMDERRESREGWALDDGERPTKVTGCFCENPADPEREHPMWWCPKIGYSIPESSLYDSWDEARQESVRCLTAQRDRIDAQLAEIAGRQL